VFKSTQSAIQQLALKWT